MEELSNEMVVLILAGIVGLIAAGTGFALAKGGDDGPKTWVMLLCVVLSLAVVGETAGAVVTI